MVASQPQNNRYGQKLNIKTEISRCQDLPQRFIGMDPAIESQPFEAEGSIECQKRFIHQWGADGCAQVLQRIARDDETSEQYDPACHIGDFAKAYFLRQW